MSTTSRHFVAEFVGTFALVFVGSGAIMMAQHSNSQAGVLAVAMAHGIILAVMVSSTMNVSGGHLNPAITIGMLVTKRIPAGMAGVHIIAQVLGASAAAFALKGLVPHDAYTAVAGGTQTIASDVSFMQAVGLEVVATFFLAFVIFGTAVDPDAPRLGGMAIGLTIGADILAIGPLTGGSMNPARSFGPALAAGIWQGHIAYWIGPIIGAVLAALVWDAVLLKKSN
jgi:MIP family channel proteins